MHGQHIQSNFGGFKEYAKLAVVFVFIVTATSLLGGRANLSTWLQNFMGMYLLVFGTFKLADLKMLAMYYPEYDIISRLLPWWSWFYPFLEVGLGLLFLFGVALAPLNIFMLILMSLNAAGVLNELAQKNKIRCACLGKFVNLPITTISLLEDILMVATAATMLLLSI